MALNIQTQRALDDLKNMGISAEIVEKLEQDFDKNPQAQESFGEKFLSAPEFSWLDEQLKNDFELWTADLTKLAELKRLSEIHPDDSKIVDEINVINSRLIYQGFQKEILDTVTLKTVDTIVNGLLEVAKEDVNKSETSNILSEEDKKEGGEEMGITAEDLARNNAGLVKINSMMNRIAMNYFQLKGEMPEDDIYQKAVDAGLEALWKGQSPEITMKESLGIPQLIADKEKKKMEDDFNARLLNEKKQWMEENNIIAPIKKKPDPFMNKVVKRETTDSDGKELLPYQRTALADRQKAKNKRLENVLKDYQERINV